MAILKTNSIISTLKLPDFLIRTCNTLSQKIQKHYNFCKKIINPKNNLLNRTRNRLVSKFKIMALRREMGSKVGTLKYRLLKFNILGDATLLGVVVM